MPASSPSWAELRALRLADWHPRQKLQLPVTGIDRASVPAIDVHNHLGRWLSDGEWMIDDVSALVAIRRGDRQADAVGAARNKRSLSLKSHRPSPKYRPVSQNTAATIATPAAVRGASLKTFFW